MPKPLPPKAHCPRCGDAHDPDDGRDETTLCARCEALRSLVVERFTVRRRGGNGIPPSTTSGPTDDD